MELTLAARQVRETLQASFDKDRYIRFIQELTGGFELRERPQAMLIPDAFKAHIQSCTRYGTFTDQGTRTVDILVVRLTAESKLDRTRTALRDFVAHKLKRGEDSASWKDAALVAFVAPNEESWRFSFVKLEYDSNRDERTGRVRPEEHLTPARRSSYLVGSDEHSHTAQSRFAPLLGTTRKISLEQLEHAFSVESVSDEFFGEYVRLFDATRSALENVVIGELKKRFDEKGIILEEFAKKLLGQIVFLYFIQKKGWLGVPRDSAWGEGKKDFLRRLCIRALSEERSFFSNFLEPLFYDSLAVDRGHDAWSDALECRVPFLNGGLFEPLDGYDWRRMEIPLPNELFSNQLETGGGDVGTGILDVFDRYNFTVNEAEPLEKDVAIDPEMLGKVFEKLIEENRRKKQGAFYTPREVVHFMCQESLINYLETNLQQQGVSRSELSKWIRHSDIYAHFESARATGTRIDNDYIPPKSIRDNARAIDALLADITVLDPAVGSGAFPVGMMAEIVRARRALTPYFNDPHDRSPYTLKRHTILHSLHGVDIDPGAIVIAKLRLWLSLVVDEEQNDRIKPLPNLDYKLLHGDSLSRLEDDLLTNSDYSELERLRTLFFDATDPKAKEQHRSAIDTITGRLRQQSATFDFKLLFSEVFLHKDGFDVAIANPPYGGEKPKGVSRIIFGAHTTQSDDPYGLFVGRAIQLLRPDGALSFVISDTWRTLRSHYVLRRYILEHSAVDHVIDLPPWIFKSAMVNTCVLTLRKRKPEASHRIAMADLRAIPKDSWSTLTAELTKAAEFSSPEQSETVGRYHYLQSEIGGLETRPFFIGLASLNRFLKDPLLLRTGKIANVVVGLQTSDNEFYLRVLGEKTGKYRSIEPDEILSGPEIAKLSSDEKRNGIPDGKHFLPYDKGGESDAEAGWLPNYFVPTTYFIDWSTKSVSRLRTATRGDNARSKGKKLPPSKLSGSLASRFQNYDYYFKKGITFSPTGMYGPTFRLGSSAIFGNKGSSIFPSAACPYSVEALLGLLCSLPFRYLVKVFIGHTVEADVEVIKAAPLPRLDQSDQTRLETLVKQIIEKQKRTPHYNYACEEQKRIDELVFQAYGMTTQEIAEVKIWYVRRYGRLAEAQGFLTELDTLKKSLGN